MRGRGTWAIPEKTVKNILLQTDFMGEKCCKEIHQKKFETYTGHEQEKKQSSRTYISLVSLAPLSIV